MVSPATRARGEHHEDDGGSAALAGAVGVAAGGGLAACEPVPHPSFSVRGARVGRDAPSAVRGRLASGGDSDRGGRDGARPRRVAGRPLRRRRGRATGREPTRSARRVSGCRSGPDAAVVSRHGAHTAEHRDVRTPDLRPVRGHRWSGQDLGDGDRHRDGGGDRLPATTGDHLGDRQGSVRRRPHGAVRAAGRPADRALRRPRRRRSSGPASSRSNRRSWGRVLCSHHRAQLWHTSTRPRTTTSTAFASRSSSRGSKSANIPSGDVVRRFTNESDESLDSVVISPNGRCPLGAPRALRQQRQRLHIRSRDHVLCRVVEHRGDPVGKGVFAYPTGRNELGSMDSERLLSGVRPLLHRVSGLQCPRTCASPRLDIELPGDALDRGRLHRVRSSRLSCLRIPDPALHRTGLLRGRGTSSDYGRLIATTTTSGTGWYEYEADPPAP